LQLDFAAFSVALALFLFCSSLESAASLSMKSPFVIPLVQDRAEAISALRRLLPRLESFSAQTRILPFDIPALDFHLPQGGLALAGLHEIAPETESDRPAAFGFLTALLGHMPKRGPLFLVASPREFAEHGRPYGHGLHHLGLDPARAIIVKTADPKQALWAMEEALRSGVPSAVAGTVERLDLRASQRLQLAAGESGVPLLALRPARAFGSSVALTRWRVATVAAARDRFSLITEWRWRLKLERCRNGRPGEWVVEFNHAYRFRLASALADPAVSRRAGAQSVARAG
jgi:protein ImuA